MNAYRYERNIAIDRDYDLVVAGGGPGGVCAAIAAGRLGARVLLVEKMGCLGGMGTSGIVASFDPMANGERNLVGGIMLEILETLYKRGDLPPQVTPDYWHKYYLCWTPFNPESLKLLLDELVLQAGVEVRFYTSVVDADVDAKLKKVKGVVVSQVDGLRYVPATTFVDATGDAILSALCGADYREAGRDTPRIMPPTLTSLCAGVDWARFGTDYTPTDDYEDDPVRPKPHRHFIAKAIEDGFFTQPDRGIPGLWRVGHDIGYINAGHVFGMSSVNSASLSEGMMRGRKLAREYIAFYRKYVPGCEDIEIVTTGALMGVRESRRIVGEYELTIDDYLARRQFPDQIGVFNKFVDNHTYDASPEEWRRFQEEISQSGRIERGECFGIPYGILVPRGWKNLWVAGRCASSDPKAHGVIRVMPAAGMMGQAAGTAAVQCVRRGESAGDLDTAALVSSLRAQGAVLEQPKLSKEMTRSKAG